MTVDRRSFLRLLTRSVGAGVALTGGALYLHNRPPRHRAAQAIELPDYRRDLPEPDSAMAIIRTGDSRRGVDSLVEALGGIDRFVRPGESVLIKPNVGFDRPASFGATTSPEVVSQVVRLCRKAGARHVWVTDNPINNPSRCFAVSGIGAAVEDAGGSIVTPDRAGIGAVSIHGSVLSSWEGLAGILARADRLIGIPTVKDHNLAGISVCMKNWYGFLGAGRNTFHQRLTHVIADLAGAFSATLVIVDGTRSLLRNGPTGGSTSDVLATERLAAGTDQVALDAWAAEIMSRSPYDVPSIVEADARGIGTAAWRTLEFRELKDA